MHGEVWTCDMQKKLHEVCKIESLKPILKLYKNLFDFEKNPKFCKNPKNLGFKT